VPRSYVSEYTHFGKSLESIDGRSTVSRPLQESWVGRRHENVDNGAVIGNLHGGMAERRAGRGGTSTGTKTLFRSGDDAPLPAAADSVRRHWRRACC